MYDRHLDSFIAAAELGSLTKAGTAAHVSVQAVIKQVNQLEAEVGARLFARSSRGVELTPAGRVVYRAAKEIVGISERAVREARETEAGTRRVRVGTSVMRPCTDLVGLWSHVAWAHPDIQLEVVPFSDDGRDYHDLLSSLGDRVDVVAGTYVSAVERHGCRAARLADRAVCVAVSRRNPLAGRDALSVGDLHGQELIVIRRGDSAYIDAIRDLLEAEHPQVHIVDVDVYDASAFNLCEARGCAMLSFEAWADTYPSLACIPVEWDFTVPYGVLYPMRPDPAVAEFVDAVLGSSRRD